MTTVLTEAPPRTRLDALDGVRGLFALGVFGTHAYFRPLRGAWIGVDVFFVLSGYLITTILVRQHRRDGRISLKRFALSRVLRLYPVMLLTVAGGCLLYLALPTGIHGERSLLDSALSTITYTENLVVGQHPSRPDPWSHTWSLAEEEQYYLLWPALLALVLAFLRTRAAAVAFGLAVASAVALLMTRKGAYYFPWTHASGLAIGSMLGLLLAHDTGALTRALRPLRTGLVAVAGLTGVLAYLDFQPFASKRALVVGVIGTAVFAGLLVGHLVTAVASPVSRVLAVAPLRLVGRWSYAFYLLHVPVLASFGAHLGRWPAIVLAFVVTIGLSAGLHYAVERPMDRVRHRLFPS